MKLLVILFLGAASMFASGAGAQDKLGVLLMHGKQGGGPRDGSLESLHRKMLEAGMLVIKPEMPWSFNRYIEGHWNLALTEVGVHIQKLKEMGAARIALVGHSLGSPAALSYTVRHPGAVNALVLLAPGHIPLYYSQCIPFSPIRMCGVKDAVERARKEVDAGNADKQQLHTDINQGRPGPVWMTPRDYLSYFDPASDAEMAVTAPKIGADVAVLWVIGDRDYLIREGRQYVFDKLPANSKNQYLEVSANHMTTPAVASDQIVNWLKSAAMP